MRTMNAAAPISRLVLLAPPRNESERDAKIRRYRLARLKLTEPPRREAPFAHLKRMHD
jgi:hypothetical protein